MELWIMILIDTVLCKQLRFFVFYSMYDAYAYT